MSDFSPLDVEILEEIVYSPLKVSMKKLARNVGCKEEDLSRTLDKLSTIGLLVLSEDLILVEKERRKYFEFEITRFDPCFRPDMEFLQGLLRKVPIHVLPSWYSIPRASNNIFESIVEKYLLTPHVFQRYLTELNLGDPIFNGIIQDVHSSSNLKVSSSDLIAKYNLKRRDFEEMILILEFNFVCCLTFEKADDHWLEFVVPFHEWSEYLRFFRETEAPILNEPTTRFKESDFAFIEEMSESLLRAKKEPIAVQKTAAIEKLCLTKLAEYTNGKLIALEAGDAWLDLSLEARSLYLYRHPNNRISSLSSNERCVREAEKAIKRVLHGEWVYLEDFLKGALVPLNEDSVVMLKRFGKQWKYSLPSYSEEERKLLRATLFEWLYEFGMVAIGTCRGKECFAVTPFGRFFFED